MQVESRATHQGQSANMSEPADARRAARAHRILDAASSLIRRHGSDRITIDDIAREAGVGKGTIYLHWQGRDALFAALILREKIAMAEDIKRRLTHDPAGATLRGLLKHAALALIQRPLLKAVLLRDPDAYGKLARREQGSATSAEVLAGFTNYLQQLREQGLTRLDLSLRAQAAIFGSIFVGFFLAAPLLPNTFRLSDDELAELMAETGHRALEPRALEPHAPLSPAACQSTAHSLTRHLERSVANAQERLQGAVQIEDTPDPLNASLAARARGRKGGRAKKLNTAAKVAEARRMYADKSKSIEEICAALGISRASLYRYINNAREATV